MRRAVWLIAVVGLFGVGVAQDSSTPSSQKLTGRLPNHYPLLNLSDKQRERIYLLQDRYNAEIKDLEQQLALTKAKRDGEIEKVLTESQRRRYKQIVQEKAAQKEKTGSKKSEPTE